MTVKIGWYDLEESFDGEISIVVTDRRNGAVHAFACESLESYDRFIVALEQNQAMSALPEMVA